MRDAAWIAHPASPQLPGIEVSRQAAADHRLAVDLDALPADVHRVNVMLAVPTVPGGPASFGGMTAPFVAATGLDGTGIASYTLVDLDTESAVVALEIYRRNDAWKVRAVGQGYAGGLAAMLDDQGLPQASSSRTPSTRRWPTAWPVPCRRRGPAPGGSRVRTAPVGGDAPGVTRPRPAAFPRAPAALREAVPEALRSVARPAVPATGRAAARPAAPASAASGAADALPRSAPAGHPPGPSGPAAPAAGPSTTVPRPHPGPARPPAPAAPPAPPGQPAQPVAGDAAGWTMDERLYNQVWGMFEDLARTAAAYRSAVDFADSRMDQELERALSDPRTRVGPQADAARDAARAKQTELVDQARAVLDRDLAQLDRRVRGRRARAAAGLRPLGQPGLAGLPGADGDPDGAAPRRPAPPRTPGAAHPDAGAAAAGARALDRQRPRGFGEAALADSHELRRLAVDTAIATRPGCSPSTRRASSRVHVIDPAGSAAAALAPAAGDRRAARAACRRRRRRARRCWRGSPSGSTWCRWPSAAAPPTPCRRTSTPPNNC